MSHTQKGTRSVKTISFSELCSWKQTSAIHKPSKTNWQQMLTHLEQYRTLGAMKIGMQLATEEEGGPFGIGVTLPVRSKQGNYSNEETAEIPHRDEGSEHQWYTSNKEEAYAISQCHNRSPDITTAVSPPLAWGQRQWELETGSKWMADPQDPELFAIKMGWKEICLFCPPFLQICPPPPTKGRRDGI